MGRADDSTKEFVRATIFRCRRREFFAVVWHRAGTWLSRARGLGRPRGRHQVLANPRARRRPTNVAAKPAPRLVRPASASSQQTLWAVTMGFPPAGRLSSASRPIGRSHHRLQAPRCSARVRPSVRPKRAFRRPAQDIPKGGWVGPSRSPAPPQRR